MSSLDFSITPDTRMLREGFRDLLAGVVTETETRAVLNGPTFSSNVWKEIARGGWLGIAVADGDPPLGSEAAPVLTHLSEEIGARFAPAPFALVAGLVVPLLTELVDDVAPVDVEAVVDGTQLATIVLPTAGSPVDPRWPSVTVATEERNRVQLSGTARGVLAGDVADVILVPVERLDKGLAIAAIAGDTVERTQSDELDFSRPTATIEMANVWVDKGAFLGGWDRNCRQRLVRWLWHYMLCLDGESVGGARAIVERTIKFVDQRRQFGVAIGSFQAVKHLLANAYGELEITAALTHQTAWRLGGNEGSPGLDVACSRVLAAEMYPRVVETCIQCHGGVGFTWEEGLHGWYRQALFYRHHPFALDRLRDCIWEIALRAQDGARRAGQE